MADRCIRSHVAGSNGQFYIGVPKGPPIYTISGYISLRRGIATIPMAGRTTLAATATVGRRFRTRRTAVVACTSARRACTRCTAPTAAAPSATRSAPSKNRREASIRLFPAACSRRNVYRRSRSKKILKNAESHFSTEKAENYLKEP